MPLSPARLAALRILLKIEQGGGFAVDLLHDNPVSRFNEADRRLVTELVYGVLRQKSCLDWYLASLVERPLEGLDREVRMVLRLGAYQILFLSRVPVRAVVHQSVELVKQSGKRSASGLANAVLRRVDEGGFEQACIRLPLDSPRGLSLRFSHPEWLVSRWIDRWGLQHTSVVLNHNNNPPRVHFRSNSPRLGQEEMVTILEAENYSVYPYHTGEGIWVVDAGDLTKSSLYRSGQLAIQGAGSQVIASLLELKPSDVCLDLCSGTGGKASHMVQLGKGRASVYRGGLQFPSPPDCKGASREAMARLALGCGRRDPAVAAVSEVRQDSGGRDLLRNRDIETQPRDPLAPAGRRSHQAGGSAAQAPGQRRRPGETGRNPGVRYLFPGTGGKRTGGGALPGKPPGVPVEAPLRRGGEALPGAEAPLPGLVP